MNSEEYKAKTDEEIIELIHKGEDKYAQEYMLVKYKPLVMACSKSCFISGAEKRRCYTRGYDRSLQGYKGFCS